MNNTSFDVIVVGSGHNGLITACYLARDGYRVCVVERQDSIGGAVNTETMFGSDKYPNGFRMDVGSSVHIMIHQTGIVEDLELEKYGLDYIDLDPFMSYPIPDGKGVIHFYRDLDKTCESIASVSPSDAENYRNFVNYWSRINRGVLRAFMVPPKMGSIGSEIIRGQIRDGSMFKKGEHMDGLQRILSSYGKVVDNAFDSPYVKAAMIWFAAQSGPAPDHPATGDFTGWQAMLHESGAKHPRGGSGMLTQAMKRFIEAHGGEVHASTPVQNILVKDNYAQGVELQNGEKLNSKMVVSNAHVQTTMLKLVGPDHIDRSLLKKVKQINVGNGFGMVIRCAVEELPNYRACPDDPHVHNGMQLLSPSTDYMYRAIGDHSQKNPPKEPAVLAMTFSKVDKDVAPDGGHTLFAWAQWHPYELSGARKWDDIREAEGQKIYDKVVSYAPNMSGKLIDWYIQSPLDIERKHGLLRGNVMHVEMSFDQMFMFRPTPDLSNYETPIKNLYLSSASCHPGGGVFGAAGYNAYQVIRRHHKKKWFK